MIAIPVKCTRLVKFLNVFFCRSYFSCEMNYLPLVLLLQGFVFPSNSHKHGKPDLSVRSGINICTSFIVLVQPFWLIFFVNIIPHSLTVQ